VSAPRTLHVKCSTWEEVSTFTSRKLRRGKLLSMKVPFAAEINAAMTLGLELPNGLVIAIDGTIRKASAVVGDAAGKTWIEIELIGFTDEVMARIKDMASGRGTAQPPGASANTAAQDALAAGAAPIAPRRTITQVGVDSLPTDERELFQTLAAELRRMRQLAVHDVLDVSQNPGPGEVRDGWMDRIRRHHPDLVARRNSPAITHLAEELTILCNRAYDRLRASLVSEGRAQAPGPAISAPPGWLVGFEDIASDSTPVPAAAMTHAQGAPLPSVIVDRAPAPRADNGAKTSPPKPKYATIPPASATATLAGPGAGVPIPPISAVATPNPQGGEAFEMRARTMLGQGDAETAREVLAAALCVYPRSRPLRSLYFVASALAALQAGEAMLAMSQLETALAHHENCTEAAAMLEHMRKHQTSDLEALQRLFR
jgi:hypothetical protein